ncbi:MAG: hypothetical protein KF760_07150 [Candidatus Eremiobacteraeota bacterium]|nr:hypothetical protein [Candidatus Eremiobacteraeota bacterium]MCW5869223.1 hypothetical protein [Candidatus Eremiobacteraeota bacterium]
MKNRLFTGFLALGLAVAGWSAGMKSNRIANGGLLESPNPSTMSGAEEFQYVWKAPLEVGANVPGFKVTREPIFLVWSKQTNRRWLELNDGGGVSQSVPVQAGQTYVLKFVLEGNPQGDETQSIHIVAPGVNRSETVMSKETRPLETRFTANSDQAPIEIYATEGGRGPRIHTFVCESI